MIPWLQTVPGAAPDTVDAGASIIRVLAILAIAAALHLIVRGLRRAGEWIVTPDSSPQVARDIFARRRPKVATVTTLVVSAVTFVIYFVAFGLVVIELDVFDVRTYFASATVIGLAVGFGSQGLVQDVVIGLTLIFSDAFNVGDVVEISGQVGRVEKVGLRFTTLVNFLGQTVYIPNRNIGLIGRYRRGAVRAFADVQLTDRVPDGEVIETVARIASGMRAQQPSVMLAEPEVTGPFTPEPGDWRFIRVKFRLWPGQAGYVETAFRQRALAAMKRLDPDYADWMLTVTLRSGR
ncbi:MAG TPA: mechanosensitive ion channel domain-containing protein [Longimicrobiales bacterium]|nr:mechanosensitive ion channel domain-containing protein [Longimicrobiales bacterium]